MAFSQLVLRERPVRFKLIAYISTHVHAFLAFSPALVPALQTTLLFQNLCKNLIERSFVRDFPMLSAYKFSTHDA
jgi:hypothetical protein